PPSCPSKNLKDLLTRPIGGCAKARAAGGLVTPASASLQCCRRHSPARWGRAWGKLPTARWAPKSYASVIQPTSLHQPTRRSDRRCASARRPRRTGVGKPEAAGPEAPGPEAPGPEAAGG